MLTIVLLSTTCLLILADQLTKVWAVEQLHNANRVISVIDGVFEFRYLENRGVAFGMMQGQTWLLPYFLLCCCSEAPCAEINCLVFPLQW